MDSFQNYQDIWQDYDDVWAGRLPAETDGFTRYIFRAGVLSMDIIEKTPYDQIEITVFFDGDLDPTESLVSHTVTSINLDTGVESTATLIAADELSGQQVNLVLKTGQSLGENHKITISAIADTATTIEKEVFVNVAHVIAGHFEKQPIDNFLVKLDFSNLMELTETLDNSSISITGIDTSDASDVTATTVGVSRVSEDDQGVIFVIKGGSDGDHLHFPVEVDCTDLVQGVTKKLSRIASITVRES